MEREIKQLLRQDIIVILYVVDKSNLGACWKVDCCDYEDRENDDKCGLDNSGLSLVEKMRAIMRESFLKKEFERLGLGTVL